MKPNEWKWVSVVAPIKKYRDGKRAEVASVKFLFESLPDGQTVYLSGMKLEVFDDVVQPMVNKYY